MKARAFTEEESQDILQSFQGRYAHRNKLLLSLGITSGFRVSELLSIKIRDVSLYGIIPDDITVPRKRTKGKRTSYTATVHPYVKTHIINWVKQMEEDDNFKSSPGDFLFQSQKSNRLRRSSVNGIIKSAAIKCGYHPDRLSSHTMRKTFALLTYLYWAKRSKEGEHVEPMRMVQLALHHADISTTYKYMEFLFEKIPHQSFDDFLFSKPKRISVDNNSDNVDTGT